MKNELSIGAFSVFHTNAGGGRDIPGAGGQSIFHADDIECSGGARLVAVLAADRHDSPDIPVERCRVRRVGQRPHRIDIAVVRIY